MTAESAAPRQIGPYAILDAIGEGGMGVVYRARDERVDREVAVKLLRPDHLRDEVARKRFLREARALAKLNHPSIEMLLEFDRADGLDYLVSEYVPGMTLAERIRQGPLDPGEVNQLALQLVQGLVAAHEQGIVHRDLKPANLRITPEGRLKILDFGLAKSAADEGESLTAERAVVGTVPYMAPEQLRGGEIDARTDIYAVGAVLYEMATGARPFPSAHGAALVKAILGDAPLAPSASGVSAMMESILLKALAKSPESRYQTARELLGDLERLTGVTEGTPAAHRSRMRRRWLLTAGVVALAGATAGGAYLAARGDEIGSVAVLPLVNSTGRPEDAYLADGIAEGILHRLSELPGVKVIARASAFRYRGDAVDPRAVHRALGARAVLTGRIEHRKGAIAVAVELTDAVRGEHLWGKRYERPLRDLPALSQDLARTVAEKLRVRLSAPERERLQRLQTASPEAHRLVLLGRFHLEKFTVPDFRAAIRIFGEAIEHDPTYARAHVGLAEAYYGISSIGMPAREAMPLAKAAARKALEIDDRLGEAYATLALVQGFYEWNWSSAEASFRRAIERSPSYAFARQSCAMFLAIHGRFGEARAESERAHALDPLSPSVATNDAAVHLNAGDVGGAIAELRRVLDAHPAFVPARRVLADALQAQANLGAARAEIELARQNGGANDPSLLARLAELEALSGERGSAERRLRALEARASHEVVSPVDLAIAHTALGDRDGAFRLLEKACDDRDENLVLLKVDRRLAPLRSDPRFPAFLRRIGLAP
jgi:serine/threonine-protein kinase